MKKTILTSALALATIGVTGMAVADDDKYKGDFGQLMERLLNAQSEKRFGVEKPLATPATNDDVVARELASAEQRVLLAKGLKVEFVARNLARSADMFAFWPSADDYSHLVVCIEQGRAGTTPAGNGGLNAAVQRVDVNTGEVETVLHGMSRCDGIRNTGWGTVLATEETGDGRAYEIIDPLNTTGHWVADRASGDIRDGIDSPNPSTNVVQRPMLPTMAWEGLTVLANGVVIGGDELRPGSGTLDTDGGAIFKFVPDQPHQGGVIDDLAHSPLVAGSTYAMTVSCREQGHGSFPQYGQGCEIGQGAWVKVTATDARNEADAKGATGYYRPEDLHRDTAYEGDGVRFCWTNTGREAAENYGEVLCAIDRQPAPVNSGLWADPRSGFEYLAVNGLPTIVTANRFFEGDPRFNSVDNLHIQPKTGNVYIIEDHRFGEVFACLPDGADRDIKTDGCVGILSITDPSAEPTGFEFDAGGVTAYVILQHGQQPEALKDFTSNPVDGTTDDLLKITGFKIKDGKEDKDD